MTRYLVLLVVAWIVAACGTDAKRDEHGRSKREADSALGASGLPGAAGITRSIGAADSAAARAARLDSMSGSP